MATKIYLVTLGESSENYQVVGAYSTLEKAREHQAKYMDQTKGWKHLEEDVYEKNLSYLDIEEHDIDDPIV